MLGEVGLGGTGGGIVSLVPELERVIGVRLAGLFVSRSVPLVFPSASGICDSSGMYFSFLETARAPFSRSLLCFVLLSCLFVFSSSCDSDCLLYRTAVIKDDDIGNPPDVTDLNSMVSGSISRSSDDKRPEASPLHWAYDLPCWGDLGGMI